MEKKVGMSSLRYATLDEVRQIVEAAINQHLMKFIGEGEELLADGSEENLNWDEVRALADEHRWSPPAGAKSSLQLLHEDRDGPMDK